MTREELLKDAKPILFNTNEVQATLDGRKTVARRLPSKRIEEKYYDYVELVSIVATLECISLSEKQFYEQYPPYQTGDILYVRERFCKGSIEYGEEPDGRAAPYVSQCAGDSDIIPYEYCIREKIGIEDVVWRPSIHMPKEAARIFLRVTDVRVERLQEMEWTEALDEGIEHIYERGKAGEYLFDCNPLEDFSILWDSTIKKSDLDRYGWEANPWVWVIEFERVMADENVN